MEEKILQPTEGLPHENIGQLAKHIRLARNIHNFDKFAEVVGANSSSLSRFEQGHTSRFRSLNSYAEALASKNLTPNPITQDQANVLKIIFKESFKSQEREDELSYLDASYIWKLEGLKNLLNDLETISLPAFIRNDIGGIIAQNEALLRFYNVETNSPSEINSVLGKWYNWDVIASKFHLNSPAYKAHLYPDTYFPAFLLNFFENEKSNKYLFTTQMKEHLSRVIRMSEEQGTQFYKWWSLATAFDIPQYLFTRQLYNPLQSLEIPTIFCQAEKRAEIEIVIDKQCNIGFRLFVWKPFGSDSQKVFEDFILRFSRKRNEVYFISDYDKEKKFWL